MHQGLHPGQHFNLYQYPQFLRALSDGHSQFMRAEFLEAEWSVLTIICTALGKIHRRVMNERVMQNCMLASVLIEDVIVK